MTILERLLNRMQSAVRLDEAFDGGDRSTFEAGREDEAGSNRLSVEQHGARTTHAVFTTHVRARLTEVVTNGIRSQSAGGKNDGVRHLVERERDSYMVLTGICCQLGKLIIDGAIVFGHCHHFPASTAFSLRASVAAAKPTRAVSADTNCERYAAVP